MKTQPLDSIVWMERTKLKPNNYNPNKVAPPEIKLLTISILEDGWTQPIVVTEDFCIIDGFHRWTVSGFPEVFELTNGMVPVVIVQGKTNSDLKMSTIRHNRARGTHAVLSMSDIVESLISEGISGEEIQERLQMEQEEVTRLLFSKGIPKSKVFESKEFSKSWKPNN